MIADVHVLVRGRLPETGAFPQIPQAWRCVAGAGAAAEKTWQVSAVNEVVVLPGAWLAFIEEPAAETLQWLADIVGRAESPSLPQPAVALSGGLGRPPALRLLVERLDPQTPQVLPVEQGVGRPAAWLGPRLKYCAAVLDPVAWTAVGPLRNVSDPIWEWGLRALRAGWAIEFTPAPTPSGAVAASALPLLAPPPPEPARSWLCDHLQRATPTELGTDTLSRVDQIAWRAALLLWHDELDASHRLAQSIEGEGAGLRGDYCHAIMHRREPDYNNAKYWFRRLGNQPLWEVLARQADVILSQETDPQSSLWRDRLLARGRWNPAAFVDLCAACAENETQPLARVARRIQLAEMCLLLAEFPC